MKLAKVLLVVKQTPYLRLRRSSTRADARRRGVLDAGHGSIRSVEDAHDAHVASVKQVKLELRARDIEYVERTAIPTRPIRGYDLVISIGGDGTLLSASHAIRQSTPILGVNSAPAYSVGFLTGCRAPTFAGALDDLIEGRIEPVLVRRLQVRLGRRILPEPVLNDVLFCHDNPAVTTRYRLMTPEGAEDQRSSGAWIAAPAGSTAALRSAGGSALPLASEQFAYVIREPYAPPGSTVRFKGGVLAGDQKLVFECRAAPTSVFLDGSHRRYSVPFGTRVSFGLHDRPLAIVRPQRR